MAPPDLSLEPELRGQVGRRLRALRASLGASLREALDALLAAKKVPLEGDPLANFTRTAQPVSHLPLWVASLAASRGVPLAGEVVWAAVESSITGYLCAQAQDALADGDAREPLATALLAHALFARHQALLGPVAAGHAAFWTLCQERWSEYAEALSFEAKVQRSDGVQDRASFDRVLGRSRPLALPGSALLARAGLWHLQPDLDRFVRRSTAAAQLFDDLLDAERDLAAGNRTWVVERMGGARGLATMRRTLYLQGGFDALLDEALSELSAARDVAVEIGMTGAIPLLDEHTARMEAARDDVARELTGHFFGRAPVESSLSERGSAR